MHIRAYLKKPASAHAESLSRVGEAVKRVGSISRSSVVPYWKFDDLEEAVWEVVLTQRPDFALRVLLEELGSGWKEEPDGAFLDCRHGGMSLDGIGSIFIDIESLDWGRFHGIFPRFVNQQRVRIVEGMPDLAAGPGTISGFAFDQESLSWSYGVLLDRDERVYQVPEEWIGSD